MEQPVCCQDLGQLSRYKHGFVATKTEQALVEREHRSGVDTGRLNVYGAVEMADREPRFPVGKSAKRRAVPWHWRAFGIATHSDSRLSFLGGVLYLFGPDRHILHAQLFSVVDGQGAGKR